MHCGHPEELPGLLLEEEVPAGPLGGADLPEARARPAGPPGLRPTAGREEEEGGGDEEEGGGGGGGEVGGVSGILPNKTEVISCLIQREVV